MDRVLNKDERKVCWDSRDLYLKCLAENDQKTESCQELYTKFEEECPKRWVKYFIAKDKRDRAKEKILKGVIPLPMDTYPKQ